ncbi:MAG: TetR/AcrR family transcriptional regulator [Deltaproteobacteria bacterium]
MREVATTAILDAAEQVASEQGLVGARIEEIARRAGVAVGTLYNYFADRDTLMAAMKAARRAELLAALEQALVSAHGRPFREQLEVFLHAQLSFYEKHRQFFAVLFGTDGGSARPPNDLLRDIHALAEKLVRRGLREGALRPDHTALYPGLLFSIVRGAAISELQRKQPAPLTDLVIPLAKLFLHGAATEHEL